MPCINAPNPTTPHDVLQIFKTYTGDVHLFISWFGTRDFDFTTGTMSVTLDPYRNIIDCFLYWNVIGAKNQDASLFRLNGNPIIGQNIAWCGNTAWSKTAADGNTPTDWANANIINKVYRANINPFVSPGPNPYTLEIVGNKPDPTTAGGADNPHYPGCNGSQGILFVFVLSDPCPSSSESQHPESTLLGERKLILYDGAKLLMPSNYVPFLGGSPSYSLNVDVGEYTQEALFITTVGDSQTTLADSLTWNGTPFPGNGFGSYWSPNGQQGNSNLISTKLEGSGLDYSPCPPPVFPHAPSLNSMGYAVNSHNVATGSTPPSGDALCWFFAAYMAHKTCCAYIPAPTPDPIAKDKLGFFKGFLGDVDFTWGAQGIRDIDTNTTPATLNVTVPGKVVKAYLYWNVIGAGDWNPIIAKINGITVQGCLLGWCGNTCWDGCGRCDGAKPLNAPLYQTTINLAYRADVTPFVTGSGTYNVSIPTQEAGNCVAVSASDQPHLPECRSGQGIILLVIYETPHVTIPIDTCCHTTAHCKTHTCPTQTIFTVRRQILVYDGCLLLTPQPQFGPYGGGFPAYNLFLTTYYNTNIKIFNGVGDAQTTYTDRFYWDGMPLPPFPSYFNPNAGHLLHAKEEMLGGFHPCDCNPLSHVATATTDVDCLSWFLFVYSGELKTLDSSQRVIRKSGTGHSRSRC